MYKKCDGVAKDLFSGYSSSHDEAPRVSHQDLPNKPFQAEGWLFEGYNLVTFILCEPLVITCNCLQTQATLYWLYCQCKINDKGSSSMRVSKIIL